jgi:CubicO group peptidase (beta-lactamase class C family)
MAMTLSLRHASAWLLLAATLAPLVLAQQPATAVAAAPAPNSLTAAQVTAIADAAVATFAPKGFSLAVVQDGEVLIELARGDSRDGQPMTPATLTNVASVSKSFTAAAVALLVHEGKLGWDDLVVDHVPEFRLSDPWVTAHMTVRDLLCHRCGLVTFAGDLLWYGSDHDDAEVLRRAAKLPLQQRFREQFGYQNLMYMVAGMVVQRRSGMAWEEFVEQRLFAPLGMTTSRAAAQRLPGDAEIALPHIGGTAVDDHVFTACKPAASIYASAHELTAWMRMLLDQGRWQGKVVLPESTLLELWRPHVMVGGRGTGAATGDFRSYGLGWFLSLERGKKLVEHDGGMPGFLSKLSLLPAERFGFVVLNNANDGVLNEAIKRALLAQRAGGDGLAEIERLGKAKLRIDGQAAAAVEQRSKGRQPDTVPSLALAEYTGRYEDGIYGPATVTLVDGALQLVLEPSRRRLFGALQHWHHDTFRIDFPDRFLPFGLVRFDLDHTGTVSGFRIDCPIADFDFAALDFRRATK